MKHMQECYEKMAHIAQEMREMADMMDEVLVKVEAGDDDDKYISDGDVTKDRITLGPKPAGRQKKMYEDDDVGAAVKIIKLSLGR